jgi:transposase InsO family protein
LSGAIAGLAAQSWRHPTTGEAVRFDGRTIERWYYQARGVADPLRVLRRQVRCDCGKHPSLSEAFKQVLRAQYREHPGWTVQLHTDNLAVRVAEDAALGPMPSYPTVRRYMRANGLTRQRRRGPPGSPGGERALARLMEREVRSYESEYVNGLWHLDFHNCSRSVLLRDGTKPYPVCLAVLDDHSRLGCHVQWYLDETAEKLAHGLSQGFQRRGLPRSLMMDNGSAMRADEIMQGLERLGVIQEFTLPYSPYQNGKQEAFWGQVEGRLVPMLEGVLDLDLALLNRATAAWVELEYNRTRHSEVGATPLSRFVNSPGVGRPCPDSETLRLSFTAEGRRSQRKSDGTVSIEGVRYEVPSRFRHMPQLCVRYARWDLSFVHLWDERANQVLARLYPLDRHANASGERRSLEPIGTPLPPAPAASGMAPLLRKLLADHAATGLPPPYLPKDELPTATEPHAPNQEEC